MNFRIRFGILPKVFVTMVAVTVIPLGAIWYLDYRSTTERLSTDIDERLSAVADNAVAYVNAWVDGHARLLHQNAQLEDIVSMDPKRQVPVVQAIAREHPWVFLAHTVNTVGLNIARSDGDTPRNYGDRAWFQQASAGAPLGRQVVISKTNGQPSFILGVPIVDKGRGTVGALSVAMFVDELTKRIANVRIGQTGYAFLVAEDGMVIAHPQTRGSLAKHPALAGLGYDAKKKIIFNDNGRTIVSYAQRTEQGWTLVAQQDYAEAYAAVAEANRNALILLVASLLFVGVLASFLAPRITRPIQNLTAIADEISRGQLAAQIHEVERADEIGGLARAIDRLKTSVELAMRRLAADQRVASKVS